MSVTYVLLPGMIGTADLFAPLLAIMPADVRRRVLTYPTDVFLPYDQVLKLIVNQLVDEQQMVVIGESYSGALALAFAAANPQRVRAVIVSGGYVTPPWPSWLRIFIRPILLRIRIPSFLIRYIAAGENASEPFVDEVRFALSKPTPEVMTRRAREALTIDNRQALENCRVPILYLAPTDDHMVRGRNLQRILGIRPDVQVARLVGPHLILQTAPVGAWNAIQAFLASGQTQSSQIRKLLRGKEL